MLSNIHKIGQSAYLWCLAAAATILAKEKLFD